MFGAIRLAIQSNSRCYGYSAVLGSSMSLKSGQDYEQSEAGDKLTRPASFDFHGERVGKGLKTMRWDKVNLL